MNNAIKLAIEKGGYRPFSDEMGCWQEHTMSDPLFWQALGKALGWGEVCGNCGLAITNFPGRKLIVEPEDCGCGEECNFIEEEWLFNAKRCFETVMRRENLEKFWKELIKHD